MAPEQGTTHSGQTKPKWSGKKWLVFSFFRSYRKVSYSRSWLLGVYPLVPPCTQRLTFTHVKAQLLPNFQICPLKILSFSGLSQSGPFSWDLGTLFFMQSMDLTEHLWILHQVWVAAATWHVHRPARDQRVPGKLPGSKQPLSKSIASEETMLQKHKSCLLFQNITGTRVCPLWSS